eukprot:scaffold51766_cov53-Attheya_sp.AAC.6
MEPLRSPEEEEDDSVGTPAFAMMDEEQQPEIDEPLTASSASLRLITPKQSQSESDTAAPVPVPGVRSNSSLLERIRAQQQHQQSKSTSSVSVSSSVRTVEDPLSDPLATDDPASSTESTVENNNHYSSRAEGESSSMRMPPLYGPQGGVGNVQNYEPLNHDGNGNRSAMDAGRRVMGQVGSSLQYLGGRAREAWHNANDHSNTGDGHQEALLISHGHDNDDNHDDSYSMGGYLSMMVQDFKNLFGRVPAWAQIPAVLVILILMWWLLRWLLHG